MTRSTIINALILVVVVMAFILVPFAVFHEEMDMWTEDFIKTSAQTSGYLAVIFSMLLASDIFLPVPSSIVSTGAGYLLGFQLGTLSSWVGMSVGCIIGYALGSNSLKVMRWIDEETKAKMEKLFDKAGIWAIVLCRPIPVLAEASVIFAGMSKMHYQRFLLVSIFSNLGISMVYALVGSYSFTVNSFLLALAGAILLPALGKLIELAYRKFQGTNV